MNYFDNLTITQRDLKTQTQPFKAPNIAENKLANKLPTKKS